MTDTWNDFITSLEDVPLPVAKPSKDAVKFPCPTCSGTGLWQRVGRENHRGERHCFACRGLGYFKTDPRKLAANREKARERKVAQRQNAQQVNADTGLLDKIRAIASWNEFAASLLEQHGNGRVWSEGQVAAITRTIQKTEASQAARAAERNQSATECDLSRIREMFDAASAHYKRPVYRAEGLEISAATAHGRNPHALYVKADGVYMGKVDGGKFWPSYDAKPQLDTLKTALAVISADPRAAAVAWGQKTGRCSCCGRELTNEGSVEAGIGPICADKWGL